MDKNKFKAIELKCIKQAFNGNGIVKYNNKEYEISNILPGEVGLFEINKNERTPIELKNIINHSSSRINSLCPYFESCGGCQYQHMTYESELALKEEYLKNLYQSFKDIKIKPINGMPSPYNYRNKCQMTYKLSKTHNVVCGFYEEGTHKIVPVSDCKIQATKATEIINAFNKVLTKNHIEPYNEKTRKGIVRHVLVRYGFNSKEILLVIVTNGDFFPGSKNVCKDLIKLNLGITTIVQNINSRQTSIVLGDKERVLYGPGFIYDTIGKLKFKISSRSFYQVNTIGMNMLYKKAIENANISSSDILLDTYCGVGTIGLLAANSCKQVYGVELNHDAYKDACLNARINNIKNINFFNDDSTKFMTKLAASGSHIDVLIMDPPRDGSTNEFIEAVGRLKPKRIIYVSCDPKTQVRDLFKLSNEGYHLNQVEAFDMFPRTFNLECIATLTYKESKKNIKNYTKRKSL